MRPRVQGRRGGGQPGARCGEAEKARGNTQNTRLPGRTSDTRQGLGVLGSLPGVPRQALVSVDHFKAVPICK